MARERNTRLASVIAETGWSQPRVAREMQTVAAENGIDELRALDRSHIAHWVKGTRPGPSAAATLCEALTRGLRGVRTVTLAEIGLADHDAHVGPSWAGDPATALTTLRDDMFARRQLLYSTAAAALPALTWWDSRPTVARQNTPQQPPRVTAAHVDALHEAAAYFSGQDQRLGGGTGRTALRAFLATDVAAYLTAASGDIRPRLLSAAGELTYLYGWMSFDAGDQAGAQKAFGVALALAAEADDPALAGHILRAQGHQAGDLGHRRIALRYTEASVDSARYRAAGPRERALFGVVHARALASAGRKSDALAALHRAEHDLDRADGEQAPARAAFFGEAALAHETGLTLRTLGDLPGAEKELRRSVRTRALPYARTHAVTIGYLGAVQAQSGRVEEACTTWHLALDAMTGIRSDRAAGVVRQMLSALSPLRGRGGSVAAALDARAREALLAIG
ncbi:Tat pathway signal protein [Kitasatospora sp. NPDC088783]|uniref:Tat pathway signal protein n=1 Tax=Kitasatospora sp. NPDC088783 TaxID=3364077 RepID=UPI00381E00C4